jgi:hypothetical protein
MPQPMRAGLIFSNRSFAVLRGLSGLTTGLAVEQSSQIGADDVNGWLDGCMADPICSGVNCGERRFMES